MVTEATSGVTAVLAAAAEIVESNVALAANEATVAAIPVYKNKRKRNRGIRLPNFLTEKRIDVVTYDGTATDTMGLVVETIGKVIDIPVSFTVVRNVAEAEDIPMNRCLLLGGCDIDPQYYGEKPEANMMGATSKTRDMVEWVLVNRAIKDNMPMLGICRGHQMIAVAHGGTLYQDFKKQMNTIHSHTHPLVDVQAPLSHHLATQQVNSYHHQSVKAVPPGFRVLARAQDGIIESIWRPGVLGVQFHPELMVTGDADWMNIFAWFVLDGCR